MRLFTALDLPDPIREQCATLQRPEALDARWTSPNQFHVTLRFIGDVDADAARRYETALGRIEAPVPDCQPYGLDALPSRRTPSVLIVGLERTESLLSVYQSVSNALEAEGLDPETRTYRPHVTLARVDDAPREAVHSFLQAHDADRVAPFHPTAVTLYESTLTPDGAVHEPRASIPLGE